MHSKKRLYVGGLAVLLALVTCSWIIYDVSTANAHPTPEINAEISLDPELTLEPDDRKNQVLMELIYQGLLQVHYSPAKVNDEFSQQVFDLYLERIDLNKRFLLQEDVDKLNAYRDRVDDQVKTGSFDLYDLAYDLMRKREADMARWYPEILAEPFDYKVSESIEFDADKLKNAANPDELKERWRKQLKYETMAIIADKLDTQEKAVAENDTSVTIKEFDVIEKEAREKVSKRYSDWVERLDKLDREDRRATYINAFTSGFGPHTEYFPPADKANFDIAMSGQLEGIGARLVDKEGYITVNELVPGGPAALQGELEAEDKIVEVAQEGEEPVNVVDSKIDDTVKLIRGAKGTVVTLTVKKIDGSSKKISITRDVVEIEETYAKSAIVELDGNKVGVINLPKFYADFQRNGGHSCAEDVKAEVEKLKEEGVDGIILDLRNNGGGSLYDAIKMAGLFIEEGPIVQVKDRTTTPEVLFDEDNKSILYDGALVVMVNRFSASASEILAAAIQDYNRGIILGSSSSFGKGTVQQFIELDRFVDPAFADVKPLGHLKITLQKFYRVNGGATQLKGVTPDITIPDNWNYMDVGEKDHEFVMPWDEITPASFTAFKPKWNESKVVKASERRIKDNASFQLIDENAQRLKRQQEKTMYSLNLEEFRADRKAREEEAKKYKDISKKIKGMTISSTKKDQAELDADPKRLDRVKTWHKSMAKDVYLEEAIRVIADMK